MFNKLTKQRVMIWIVASVLAAGLGGCDKSAAPVKGFVLPDGDIVRGKEVFASVGCLSCHTIAQEDFPPFEPTHELNVELGGKVHRVKNYGELLTSIVNPNHIVSAKYRATLDRAKQKNAQSPMPTFNDKLNVEQLIDLTAYLHSRYELLVPQYHGYYYGP